MAAAELVAAAAVITKALETPLLAWAVIRRASGIRVDGLLRDRRGDESIDRAPVGRTREFDFGGSSGRAHLRKWLQT